LIDDHFFERAQKMEQGYQFKGADMNDAEVAKHVLTLLMMIIKICQERESAPPSWKAPPEASYDYCQLHTTIVDLLIT
jgi:hypothetical protein